MRFVVTFFFIIQYSFLQAQVYTPVDVTSTVSFKIKNFGATVDGRFKGLKGTIEFNPSRLAEARFDVTINTATLHTGIGMRDKHLHKPDYFGVEEFPVIRFVSSKVEKSSKANEAMVTGRLTIKKTIKVISIPFRYNEKNGLQFTGEFKINRRDFNVGGNSLSLADDLVVMLNVWASPVDTVGGN